MLYAHRRQTHRGAGTHLKGRPWADAPAPWENEDHEMVDEDLHNIYSLHDDIILRDDEKGNIAMSYNFPIKNDITPEVFKEQFNYIFEDQDYAFILNLAVGLILRNVENGSYRYFAPASNVRLFRSPILISKQGVFI